MVRGVGGDEGGEGGGQRCGRRHGGFIYVALKSLGNGLTVKCKG